jgi:CBS domain containing-hemolysin-like protein
LLQISGVIAFQTLVHQAKTRIEQLADEGNKPAKIVKKMIANLDYYLSACQLG